MDDRGWMREGTGKQKKAFSGRIRLRKYYGALGIGLWKILGKVWFWKFGLYLRGCHPEKHDLKVVTVPLFRLSDPRDSLQFGQYVSECP